MISLFFMYIDVVIFRYRFCVIVNLSFLSRCRNDCCIVRVFFSHITSRVTFSFFVIITSIDLKNSLIAIISF